MHQLEQVQLNLRKSLSEFQEYYVRASMKKNKSANNNALIVPKFIKIIHKSTKALQLLLQMLPDSDIMSFAATCTTAYKLVYSPFGFRLCRHLRPIIIVAKEEDEAESLPHFTQATVDQLCNDRNIEDADQDDKDAILLTMQTNILATKQKIRELDLLIEHYDRLFESSKGKIMYLGGQRQQYIRKCNQVQDQVDKLREVMTQTEGHAQTLRQSQQKIQQQRQKKLLILNQQKTKLSRQKQLLIKKIKSQQKQKQQGLIYAREVSRILGRLNHITGSSEKSSGKKSSKNKKDVE